MFFSVGRETSELLEGLKYYILHMRLIIKAMLLLCTIKYHPFTISNERKSKRELVNTIDI